MKSTLTDLSRATKQVMRPILAGHTVAVTEHGKPLARISPDYPHMTMSAEDFRALPLSDAELDRAINEAINDIRA